MPDEAPTYDSLPTYLLVCYERRFTHVYEPRWAQEHALARREATGLLVVPPHPNIGRRNWWDRPVESAE
jgi:hypothetical protein